MRYRRGGLLTCDALSAQFILEKRDYSVLIVRGEFEHRCGQGSGQIAAIVIGFRHGSCLFSSHQENSFIPSALVFIQSDYPMSFAIVTQIAVQFCLDACSSCQRAPPFSCAGDPMPSVIEHGPQVFLPFRGEETSGIHSFLFWQAKERFGLPPRALFCRWLPVRSQKLMRAPAVRPIQSFISVSSDVFTTTLPAPI